MIKITDKHNCCGCEACVQICPKHCISFDEDEKGFRYPKVETSECVDCGLCEKVCPVLHQGTPATAPTLYAAKNLDEEIRRTSSSGGIFTLLAEKIIVDGGVVFGAGWNEKWEVAHCHVETKDDLRVFRGSKYVQSRVGTSFKEAEENLKKGRFVLFSGTPCQIAGFKSYLRKDYENLLTVDFICHGVPSPGVFRWYLQEELNEYARRASKNTVSSRPIHSIPKGDVLVPQGLEIKGIRFRDKRDGWKKYSFALDLAEATAEGKKNSVSLSLNVTKHPYLRGFVRDLYLRPICHKCLFRQMKSGSDITLADFWSQNYMFPDFDNDTGVSAVIIKTEKGAVAFQNLEGLMSEEKSMEQIIECNPALNISNQQPEASRKFWKLRGEYTFKERVQKSLSPTLMERIVNKIKKLINK